MLPPPDPRNAHSPAEFVAAMRELHEWSGLSARQLERRASSAGLSPHDTVGEPLTQGVMPRLDVLVAFVRACGLDEDAVANWVAARMRILTTATDDDDPEPIGPRHRVHTSAISKRIIAIAAAVLCVLIVSVFLLNRGGEDEPDLAQPTISAPSAVVSGSPLPVVSVSPGITPTPSAVPSRSPSASPSSTTRAQGVRFSVGAGCLGAGPKAKGRTTLAQTSCTSAMSFQLTALGGSRYRITALDGSGCVSAFGPAGGDALHFRSCAGGGADQAFFLDGQRMRPSTSAEICAQSSGAGQTVVLRPCNGSGAQRIAQTLNSAT